MEKTSSYFSASVGLPVELASWRRADAPQVERERTLALLGRARWAFAGPGSPTYTLRQWRGTGVPEALADVPARGGTLVFGSAAACTLGTHAIPVYEIYKAGADPFWETGLDLLGRLTGLAAVVVPHFDNAEGGRYDTRYCYLGEERLTRSSANCLTRWACSAWTSTPRCSSTSPRGSARVAGTGTVTVRRRGRSRSFPAGSRLPLAELDALLRGYDVAGASGADRGGAVRAGPAVRAGGPRSPNPAPPRPARPSLRTDAEGCRIAFDAALAAADVDGCVAAILDLEAAIVAWSTDTDQNDDLDHARRVLRALVVRLGDLATDGVRDPREVVRPYVEALLELRARARAARDYSHLRPGARPARGGRRRGAGHPGGGAVGSRGSRSLSAPRR